MSKMPHRTMTYLRIVLNMNHSLSNFEETLAHFNHFWIIFILYLTSSLLATFYTLSFLDYIHEHLLTLPDSPYSPYSSTHAPHLTRLTLLTDINLLNLQYACMYVCIYIYIMYIDAYIYIYAYIYTHTYTYIHIYIYVGLVTALITALMVVLGEIEMTSLPVFITHVCVCVCVCV